MKLKSVKYTLIIAVAGILLLQLLGISPKHLAFAHFEDNGFAHLEKTETKTQLSSSHVFIVDLIDNVYEEENDKKRIQLIKYDNIGFEIFACDRNSNLDQFRLVYYNFIRSSSKRNHARWAYLENCVFRI